MIVTILLRLLVELQTHIHSSRCLGIITHQPRKYKNTLSFEQISEEDRDMLTATLIPHHVPILLMLGPLMVPSLSAPPTRRCGPPSCRRTSPGTTSTSCWRRSSWWACACLCSSARNTPPSSGTVPSHAPPRCRHGPTYKQAWHRKLTFSVWVLYVSGTICSII